MTPTTRDVFGTISARRSDGWLPLAGRLLLASIFLVAGLRKLGDYAMFGTYMTSYGVPAPALLLPLATALEIGGSILLALGLQSRWVALALSCYTLVLALVFHAFWAVDAKQYQAQLNLFLFHLETIGGMLLVVAHGAGAMSIDRFLDARWQR
jgi:putative oxidoreductase